MIRLVAIGVVSVIANGVAMIVTALILDDMTLDALGFAIAVLVFSALQVMVEPFFRQTAIRNAPALLGSTALVATLVSLIVTALVTSGLSISGFTTWAVATVLVWLMALVARALLPLIIFKKVLARDGSPEGSRIP